MITDSSDSFTPRRLHSSIIIPPNNQPEGPLETLSDCFDTFEVRTGLMSRVQWVNYLRMLWETMPKEVVMKGGSVVHYVEKKEFEKLVLKRQSEFPLENDFMYEKNTSERGFQVREVLERVKSEVD